MQDKDLLVVNFCTFEKDEEGYYTKSQIKEYVLGLSKNFHKVWLVGNIVPREGNLTSKVGSKSIEPVPYIQYNSNFLGSLLSGMIRVLCATYASSKAIINVPSMAYTPMIIPIRLLTDHLTVYVAMNPRNAVEQSNNSLKNRVAAKLKHWLNIWHTWLALKLGDSILVRGDSSRYESYENVYESKPIISIRDTFGSKETEGGFDLLYIGGLYKRKGVDILLKAFTQIDAECENYRLHIIGAGKERDSLKCLAESLEIESKVIFRGYIDDPNKLAGLYHRSDVLVHPARFGEGFPRVIDEAHTYGLPVIASELDHFGNTLIDGENVLFAEPGSVTSLANQLQKVIRSQEIQRELSKGGEERVSKLKDESAADQHTKILNDKYTP
jgi:glycosyltransferase involved in cell wall biosynthesis